MSEKETPAPVVQGGFVTTANNQYEAQPNKAFAYPMFFNDARVSSYLNNNGFVFTVRQKIRRPLPEKRIAVKGTYFKKEQIGFFVRVCLVSDVVDEMILKTYLYGSGFDNVVDWLKAIEKFNLRKGIKNIALYRADRVV